METTIFARKRNEESTSDSSLVYKANAGADLREQHEAVGSLSPKSAHHPRLISLFGFVSSTDERACGFWRRRTDFKCLSPHRSWLLLISCWGEASNRRSQYRRQ